jgi:hypothetical protein
MRYKKIQHAILGTLLAVAIMGTLLAVAIMGTLLAVSASLTNTVSVNAGPPGLARISDTPSQAERRDIERYFTTDRNAAATPVYTNVGAQNPPSPILNTPQESQFPNQRLVATRKPTSRGSSQPVAYEVTDFEPSETQREITKSASATAPPVPMNVRSATQAGSPKRWADAGQTLKAASTNQTMSIDHNQGSDTLAGLSIVPRTNKPLTDSYIAQNAGNSQTPSQSPANLSRVEREPQQFPIQRDIPAPRTVGPSILERTSQAIAEPLSRVEREPQQFPIQRDIPAPRTVGPSILERTSQAIAEPGFDARKNASTANHRSTATPTVEKPASGMEQEFPQELLVEEQKLRGKNGEEIGKVALGTTPHVSPRPTSRQSTHIPGQRAVPTSGATAGVIEIWYGQDQVFQNRNAPISKPQEFRDLLSDDGTSITIAVEDHADAQADETNPSVARVALESFESSEIEETARRIIPEVPQALSSISDPFDSRIFQAKKNDNDTMRFIDPWIPIVSELSPIPRKKHKGNSAAQEQLWQSFQASPIGKGSETATNITSTIWQTGFEEPASSGSMSGNVSIQHDASQADAKGAPPASAERSTTHEGSVQRLDQNPGKQVDLAQLMNSPGHEIWPLVAIVFALLLGVALVFVLLVTALQMITPRQQQQPLCNVSVVNGGRAAESGSQRAVQQDHDRQWDVPVENRVPGNEPQLPVLSSLTKKMMQMIREALQSSGLRSHTQATARAAERARPHGGVMEDILRQNLAIRDQNPLKWTDE